MPGVVRWGFFVAYFGLIGVAIILETQVFVQLASSGISLLFFTRRYKPVPLLNPEIERLQRQMGVFGKVRVYATANPNVKAVTNAFTRRVYISSSWVALFSKSEILGVLGHEFAHITRLRRFVLELIVAVLLSYGFAWGLYFFAVFGLSTALLMLVFEAAEISMSLFLLSFVCWRAEYRSDKEGSRFTGPEGLISVFERFVTEKDDGSETHPPSSKRVRRLEQMLPYDESHEED
jgi:Zn-dependent protease with chaperone function